MAKRRGRKPKSIPMKIGNDPSLWRYASLQEALGVNTDLIARLIQVGEERSKANMQAAKSQKSVTVSESV